MAQKYGVKRGTIYAVLNNKRWIDANYVPKTRARGALPMNTKLSQEDVDTIRKVHALGNVSQHALARQYGVSRPTIGRILEHRTWKS